MPPDISAYEQGRVRSFVSALLQHEGALVEAIEPEGLEVLAPPPVQRALGLGELARLGFGTTLPRAAQRVGLEGDWLDRFSKLLGPQGRYARHVLSSTARAPSDPEQLLAHELVLDNATFRLLGTTPAWTRYLVLDFRASAVSDDKRDWVVRLGLNLATGALPDAVMATITAVDALQFGSQHTVGNGGGATPPKAPNCPRCGRGRVCSAFWRRHCRPGWTWCLVRSSGAFVAGSAAIRIAYINITTICIAKPCVERSCCLTMIRGGAERSSGRRQSGQNIVPSSMTLPASMPRA